MLVDLRADHAQAAGVVGRAVTDFVLAGHIIEMNPLAVGGGQDALGAQDGAEAMIVVQLLEGFADGSLLKLLGGLDADVLEDLVGMMAVMVMSAAAGAFFAVIVVMMLVMLMIVIVAAAGALFTVIVMMVLMMLMIVVVAAAGALFAVIVMMVLVMLMIVVVAAAALMVLVIVVMMMLVIMVVIVAAAGAFFAMIMVMVLVMLVIVIVAAAALMIFVIVVMVLMIMVMAAAGALLAVLMVMMLVITVEELLDGQQEVGRFDGLQNLGSLQLVPGSGDDAGALVALAQQRDGLLDAVGRRGLGTAEDDGLGGLDLIVEELAEVLHVKAALGHVGHSGAALELDLVGLGAVDDDLADVGQLADAGGLDQDAVGMVGVDQLGQCVGEITHQRAADAAGIELGHLDAGILHEAAVNADLAVFVLQQHNLFALERTAEELLDQRGLARAEETGNDIYLRHVNHLSNHIFSPCGVGKHRAKTHISTYYYYTSLRAFVM